MRLSFWCICAAILFALPGCDAFPIDHVLEIHCEVNTGFDDDNLCLTPDRPGAELTFRVNQNTQKILITLLKTMATGGVKDFILENCSVVDDLNWRCKNVGTFSSVYAMAHGRYYHSLTGGGPPEFHTSSIKGIAFLGVYYGLIALPTAMTMTGYSAQALRAFGKG
jgi:hypothetical protein